MNDMALVTVWLGIMNLLLATLGAYLVYLFKRVQHNTQSLSDYKLEVAKEYAHKNDIETVSQRIDKIGQRIEARFDALQDKLFTKP